MRIAEISNRELEVLHDAEVTELVIDRHAKTLRIALLADTGVRVELFFEKVIAFRATDFVLQNVVSRVLCSRFFAFSDDDLVHWIRWSSQLSDTTPQINTQQELNYVNRIRASELTLCVLEPSWGVEIAVISSRT